MTPEYLPRDTFSWRKDRGVVPSSCRRQQKWMREREADITSSQVMSEMRREHEVLGGAVRHTEGSITPADRNTLLLPLHQQAAPSTSYQPASYAEPIQGAPTAPVRAAASSALPPEEVISRLTERITDKLRDELKVELEREVRASAVARAKEDALLEGHLARELESHTCPICYELMVPPDHAPFLLFPCGHSFCSECLAEHVDNHGRNRCPYCREKIASRAPNLPLQQLIQSFVSRRSTLRASNEDARAAGAASGAQQQGESVQAAADNPRVHPEPLPAARHYGGGGAGSSRGGGGGRGPSRHPGPPVRARAPREDHEDPGIEERALGQRRRAADQGGCTGPCPQRPKVTRE